MSFFEELKRRNVFRVGIAYLVASWLLLQVIDVVGPILRLPDSIARYALFLLVVAFLPALISAWVFELTPEGVKRDSEVRRSASIANRTGRKLDRAIMVILALAVAFLLFDKLSPESDPGQVREATAVPSAPATETERAAASNVQHDKSVVTLPFVTMSNGPDDDYFADGLTEEIINALAQVPDLLVTARTSAFHFKGQNLPVGDIAQQLGVAHIVEGSVRRAGDQLRITAQLVRAEDGFHLWSETYDRQTADIFAVQSDIAEQVVRALNVILDDEARARMQRVGTRNVDAFIAHQKGIELFERAHMEPNQISLLQQANHQFELAIEHVPDLFPAYDYHSDLYAHALISHASGLLDGDVTDGLLEQAPRALSTDMHNAVKYARTGAERQKAEFSRALLLGSWRGLSLLAQAAATAPDCETPAWLQQMGPFPAQAGQVLAALDRMGTCDPLRTRPIVHSTALEIILGRPAASASRARSGLQLFEHPFLSRQLALALALGGDPDSAESEALRRIRVEDERLLTLAMLAAIRGDSKAAANYQAAWLGIVGSNDRDSLVLEALRGNRNEANRLAGRVDAKPFGHMALLQSIYFCYCGAPFDLEATPIFASLLQDSGLEWPPEKPYDLPLKDW